MLIADGGGGGPVPQEMKHTPASLTETAASGGFTVSETGGAALISVIDELLGWLDQVDGSSPAKPLMLGSSSGARAIAPFAERVATDHQGILTVLGQLRSSLTGARDGISVAMGGYHDTDSGNAPKFTLH